MCGFVGFTNFKKDVSSDFHIIEDMNQTLFNRGPDEEGYYIKDSIVLRS